MGRKVFFFFIIFIFSCAVKPKHQHPCTFPYIEYSEEDLKTREAWLSTSFSRIQHHDPQKFKYIIHKIDAAHRLEKNIPEDSWTIKILKDPEILKESIFISASVISEEHLVTAFTPGSRIGFILSQSCDLIGPSYYKDMFSIRPQSPQQAREHWQMLHERFSKILTPHDLVTKYKGSEYFNEVTMIGTHPSRPKEKLKIEALVVECLKTKVNLHQGTAMIWSGRDEDLVNCLDGYSHTNQVLPFLKNLSKNYPVLLKSTLDNHQFDLFDNPQRDE
jgi:hypothetical protein